MEVEFLPVLIHFVNEIFFEDEEDERMKEPKVVNFVEDVVHNFNDRQFKMHFRMNPSTMENLLQSIEAIIPETPVIRGHPKLPLEKQLLLTIWYLANIESFR